MASLANPAQQAGGGASESRANRTVPEVHASILTHLQTIFNQHAGSDQRWHAEQVASFLAQIQGEAHLPEGHHELASLSQGLDLDGFLSYMKSPESAATAPPHDEDLTHPLASYFVSSSHNTYLTGNQLSSEASTEAYKNVLLRGCRCIEVDVWDGDESDSEDGGSSVSSSSSSDQEKKKKKKGRFSLLKEKMPDSLSSKLAKTSLGKKLDEKVAAEEQQAQTSKKIPEEHLPKPGVVEPRVLHGYTLTKEVSFRDVCLAVRDYAFVTNDLPVIVSLEVHCSAEQQELMVEIMQTIWKGLLATPPTDLSTLSLPKPSDLRNKIIVKVKYAPPGTSPVPAEEDEQDKQLPPGAAKKAAATKPSKIIQSLSDMGFYARGVSFKALDQPEATMPTHIFSLSEKRVADVHEKQAQQLWAHNLKYMMRTYPHGLRIGSSNLDPAPFWRKGIQVVALNWQNWDEGMMLNEGMFAGTKGYVLKPEGYRINDPSQSPSPIPHQTLDLSITLLAAQSLPLPPDDTSSKSFRPYIKVELHIETPEERRVGQVQLKNANESEMEGEYKARSKTQRGTDPDFGGEVLKFERIVGVVPQLAFVRFTVRDDEFGRDDLAAWACVRLDRVRSGYRFLHLMDGEGRLTKGVVLVRVEKRLS